MRPTSQTGDASPERFNLSRRYAAGTGGVRGLLITVLGDYVRPAPRPVPSAAFLDVLRRFGVDEQASRQALRRAATDGWLTSHRDGRYTLWRLTPACQEFLTAGAARIFHFTGTQPDWDGTWLVVLARVPETNRPVRHLLRTRLRWIGFGSPWPGVWISTHTERLADAESVLSEAGAAQEAQIFRSEHVAGTDVSTLVRQAWDLDEISRAYEEFIAQFDGKPDPDPLVRVTGLVHAWRRLPLLDPGLPAQLLPAHWSGIRAAKLFYRQHARWWPAAAAEWDRLTKVR